MRKDHKCFTWFCPYIKERQNLINSSSPGVKGLTSYLQSGHVMCSFRTEDYYSFVAFLISKKWVLLRVGYHAFSDSMETTYLSFEIKGWCKEKK